jgi:hypothetical protein
MGRIEVGDARAWAEDTKLKITSLDLGLLQKVESQVIGRLAVVYPQSFGAWLSSTTTPELLKTVISMLYVSWFYQRQYSEDESNTNDYARLLEARANDIIESIIAGTIILVEVPTGGGVAHGGAAVYPDDASSLLCPTWDDPSLGPSKFSMGQVF